MANASAGDQLQRSWRCASFRSSAAAISEWRCTRVTKSHVSLHAVDGNTDANVPADGGSERTNRPGTTETLSFARRIRPDVGRWCRWCRWCCGDGWRAQALAGRAGRRTSLRRAWCAFRSRRCACHRGSGCCGGSAGSAVSGACAGRGRGRRNHSADRKASGRNSEGETCLEEAGCFNETASCCKRRRRQATKEGVHCGGHDESCWICSVVLRCCEVAKGVVGLDEAPATGQILRFRIWPAISFCERGEGITRHLIPGFSINMMWRSDVVRVLCLGSDRGNTQYYLRCAHAALLP